MPGQKWTATELRLLTAEYPTKGLAPVVKALGRSDDAVTGMARRLGLRSCNHFQHQARSRATRRRVAAMTLRNRKVSVFISSP